MGFNSGFKGLKCIFELLVYFRPLNVRSSASTGWFTWRYFMHLILLVTHLRGLRTRPAWFVAVTIRNPFLGLVDWDTWVTCSYVCSQPYELTKSHLTCKLPCSWIASRTTVLSCSSAVWCFRYEVQEHDYFVSPSGVQGGGRFELRPGNTCAWLLTVVHTPSLDILVYDTKKTSTFRSTVTSSLDLVD